MWKNENKQKDARIGPFFKKTMKVFLNSKKLVTFCKIAKSYFCKKSCRPKNSPIWSHWPKLTQS